MKIEEEEVVDPNFQIFGVLKFRFLGCWPCFGTKGSVFWRLPLLVHLVHHLLFPTSSHCVRIIIPRTNYNHLPKMVSLPGCIGGIWQFLHELTLSDLQVWSDRPGKKKTIVCLLAHHPWIEIECSPAGKRIEEWINENCASRKDKSTGGRLSGSILCRG